MLQFLDNLAIGFKCGVVKVVKYFSEDSGDVSFSAIVGVCMFAIVVLLIVFIFRDYIMEWWDELWWPLPSMPDRGIIGT